MLVLSRKPNETVVITVPASSESTELTVIVVELRGGYAVRLGFDAPPDTIIHRREVFDAVQQEVAHAPPLGELDVVSDELRDSIPPLVLEAIDRFVEQGVRPGDFTYHVLCNDLHGAVMRADLYSLASIYPICQYLFNALPSGCWGTKEKVDAHIQRGKIARKYQGGE